MNFTTVFAGFACVALAACGGGSGGAGDAQGSVPVTFVSLDQETTDIFNQFDGLEFSTAEQVPATGSATYRGTGFYSASETGFDAVLENPDTLSNVEFATNFATGNASGRAFDFRAFDGGVVDGQLTLSGGAINGRGFSVAVSGVLNNRGVDVSYAGTIDALFVGPNAQALEGSGVVTGTAEGFEDQTVGAGFLAGR